MKKQQPKTYTLAEFTKEFTVEQKRQLAEEVHHYYLLTAFKNAREQKGMSQEELARKAQINRTTLSKIESGLRNATIGTLEKLAAALDLKLDIKLQLEQ